MFWIDVHKVSKAYQELSEEFNFNKHVHAMLVLSNSKIIPAEKAQVLTRNVQSLNGWKQNLVLFDLSAEIHPDKPAY